MTRTSVLLVTSLLAIGTGWAQTAPTTPPAGQPAAAVQNTAERTEAQGQSGEGDCPAPDSVAQPATQPQPGANGTDPNNTGSTGWTGGTGGSQIGTNAQGALPDSPTWQPPTARGLDLTGRAEPVAMATGPGC